MALCAIEKSDTIPEERTQSKKDVILQNNLLIKKS